MTFQLYCDTMMGPQKLTTPANGEFGFSITISCVKYRVSTKEWTPLKVVGKLFWGFKQNQHVFIIVLYTFSN